jgi:AraC family transcriptional regulator
MDHVRQHLVEDLTLAELAKVAHFSPHHFHRIFKGVTGETVASFTRRARLERAVFLMRGAPHRTLASIAAEVGFATPSEFSRVFRALYGKAPSTWDRRSRLDGTDDDIGPEPWDGTALGPRLVTRPACRLAYVRVRDPWEGDHLASGYRRLLAWFGDRGLPWRDHELIGLSWESGKATPLDRLVYDLGITVGPDIWPCGDVGIHQFPAVRAVEVHCTGLPATAVAWDYLYHSWLPDSGYEPDDLPAMKRFRVVPQVLDAAAWDVDCSIAVRPVRAQR